MIKDLKKELLIWAFGMLCIVLYFFFNVSFWLFPIGTYIILFVADLDKGTFVKYIPLYTKFLIAIVLFLFYKDQLLNFSIKIASLDEKLIPFLPNFFNKESLFERYFGTPFLLRLFLIALVQIVLYSLISGLKSIETKAVNGYVLVLITFVYVIIVVCNSVWYTVL